MAPQSAGPTIPPPEDGIVLPIDESLLAISEGGSPGVDRPSNTLATSCMTEVSDITTSYEEIVWGASGSDEVSMRNEFPSFVVGSGASQTSTGMNWANRRFGFCDPRPPITSSPPCTRKFWFGVGQTFSSLCTVGLSGSVCKSKKVNAQN